MRGGNAVPASQIQRIVNFQLGENLSQKLTVSLASSDKPKATHDLPVQELFSCTRANWTKQRCRILVDLTSIYVVN